MKPPASLFLRCVLWAVLLCLTTGAYAQRDSLIAIASNGQQPDSLRLRAIHDLSEIMQDTVDMHWIDTGRTIIAKYRKKPDWMDELSVELCINEAYHYFNQYIDIGKALALTKGCLVDAERIGNHSLISIAYNNMGTMYHSLGDISECLASLKSALHHNELGGDVDRSVVMITNLGVIYHKTGQLEEGLNYLYRALALSDSLQNLNYKGAVLGFIEDVYHQQRDFDRQLDIAKQVLDIYIETDNKRSIGRGYQGVGRAFQNKDQLDSAMHYYRKALLLKSEFDDTYGIAGTLLNIGTIYYMQDEYPQALRYLRESMAGLNKTSDPDRDGMVMVANYTARTFLALNQADSALHYAEMAYDLSTTYDFPEYRKTSSQLKARAYERLGQPAKALEAYKTYMELSEALFNEENTRLAEQKALTYEFEKKEAEMRAEEEQKQAILAERIKGQQQTRNLILVALALSLVSAGLLYSRYRLKQRAEKALLIKNEQVEAAKDRAEKSEAFRKRFLANMSHEIRTPMSAVIGLSRLLKDTPLDDEQSRYVHAVHHSANNLMAVLNDILDLSKIEAGKLELQHVAFHLADEIDLLEESFLPKALEKGLDLQVDYSPDVPHVVAGDAARLAQVLNNLLHNAIKFTEHGHVTLTVGQDENGIRFAVTDTGIGIAVEKMDELFESFSQVHSDDNRRYGGTGLGLAIAAELVNKMGGRLQVESELGKGSTFHFSLPLGQAAADALRAVPTASPSKIHPATGLHALIAEDDPYNAIVTTETLKKYFPGISVSHVKNGMEAVEMADEETFDIILMDVQMPEMDGYETTRTLRNNRLKSPVVALTASVIRSDIEQCFTAGMNDYIPKPFVEADFVAVVSRWLKLSAEDAEPHADTSSRDRMKALFWQLLDERLGHLRSAIADTDLTNIAKAVHLLRPQLVDAGLPVDFQALVYMEKPEDKDEELAIRYANALAEQITDFINREKP